MGTHVKRINCCCESFAAHVAEAGHRGLSIIPAKGAERHYFVLQSRGCDYADIQQLRDLPRSPMNDVSHAPLINLISEIGISFCPWCGSNLRRVIDAEIDAVQDMAKGYCYLTVEVGVE